VSRAVTTCIYALQNARYDIKEADIKRRSLGEQAYDRDDSARVVNQVGGYEQNITSSCVQQNVILELYYVR